MSEELTALTADIVSAFISHNSTRPEDMADLLKQVHGKLVEIKNGLSKPIAQDKPVPAVPIKRSITQDAVFCLLCGEGHKILKRHLRTSHNLEPAGYREMFGLKSDYSLTAPSYSESRSGIALTLGLGRKLKLAEAENVIDPSKAAEAEEEPVPAKTVRSHSKAERTRKSKARKVQDAAKSGSEAA